MSPLKLHVASLLLLISSLLAGCSTTPPAIAPGFLANSHYDQVLEPERINRHAVPAINHHYQIDSVPHHLLCYRLQHSEQNALMLYREQKLVLLALKSCDQITLPLKQCPDQQSYCLHAHRQQLMQQRMKQSEWRKVMFKLEKNREAELAKGAALGSALFPLMVITAPVLMLFDAEAPNTNAK